MYQIVEEINNSDLILVETSCIYHACEMLNYYVGLGLDAYLMEVGND
jgi:hypothetical protein